MNDPILIIPLAAIVAGALAAMLFRFPVLNRRLNVTTLSWLLATIPLGVFSLILSRLGAMDQAGALTWHIRWLPSLNLGVTLYLDHLGALFGLLITGIGTLIVIYGGYYFRHASSTSQEYWGEWRFLVYLFLFMVAMLGVVMAGDVITLFIFWEMTSVTSYLLIGYKHEDENARRGAYRSLLITGGGGIALLIGLLLVSHVANSTELAAILGQGDVLRSSSLYPTMLCLIALGAFAKSAQFPAHIWLPGAMSAPTPVSAYLHSATMVKAGIYLMARLNPALGFTDLWFWLLSVTGLITMLVGAYVGLKQNDLKALLAYSTISQLGVLMVLIGQDTEIAFKALVIGILAHALYKSALFLIAGIVDHETGTRDLRRLGGLASSMRRSFVVGSVAALSMAGLPPLFGFLAKETLLATATHPNVPPIVEWVFPAATVIAGALILAQAAMMIWDTFLGRPRDASVHGHEAPLPMWLAPAVPALLSLLIGLSPEPEAMVRFLAHAAAAVYGDEVKVSLALWTGINVPLLLSIIAVSLGTLLFIFRVRVRQLQVRLTGSLAVDVLFDALLRGVYWASSSATRLQGGRLRPYLAVILVGMVVLVAGFGVVLDWRIPFDLSAPTYDYEGEVAVLRVASLLVAAGAAIATIFVLHDLIAVIALGASALATALFMVLEPAPDVALVQFVVDVLTTVILVLALTRLPRLQRRHADALTAEQSPWNWIRDAGVALAAGAVVSMLTLVAITSRPRISAATPFYEQNAKLLVGAKDIVAAIIVDFRALDTLIEITVFCLAGLGIAALIRHASRFAGDRPEPRAAPVLRPMTTLGIGGRDTSAFLHALAYASLPLSMIIAVVHMLYGHDQPGDGFTAGVIVSLALGFWYVVFGYYRVRRQLVWLRPALFIGFALLLVLLSASVAALINGAFFSHVDFGQRWGLPLPAGVSLNTSFIFELAIFLAVLGSATYILDTLSHPFGRGDAELYESDEVD
jgi:NADH:ubiquinone oxidoreductase subunit 5 (subunit L)/multisubunit Na+/H+ antiporter MnhA subunit/multisubunit Na+/H+ antiporter MnhB subunit